MKSRRYDILALVLSGLYLLSFVSHAGLGYLFSWIYEVEEIAAISMQMHLMIMVRGILRAVVSLGIAIWLYRQAKEAGRHPFVWLLLGLCFSVVGAVFYLLIEWRDERKLQASAPMEPGT